MDRGIVAENIDATPNMIQVNRYDMGDPGSPFLFLTASQSGPCDSPPSYGDIDGDWPQVAGLEELDALITALQQQRCWMAETDPYKREDL